jgi:hypothetical protein
MPLKPLPPEVYQKLGKAELDDTEHPVIDMVEAFEAGMTDDPALG